MLEDHFVQEGIPAALSEMFKQKHINTVVIPTGLRSFEDIATIYPNIELSDLEVLKPYQEQITLIPQVRWSEGVCKLLNTIEFYLSTNPTSGVELMGVEAGFCGAQPIYPDVPYYRDMFAETDVAFFDSENPTESLGDIFGAGFQWDTEKHERFLDKCSGTRNLPAFWQHVKGLITK